MNKKTWFTGCTHFGHTNRKGTGIIQYKNRPFSDIDEHDECLIDNFNSHVKKGDDVFHHGDFALCSVRKSHGISNSLSGTKHLIGGNHDMAITKNKNLFVGDHNPFRWVRVRSSLVYNYTNPEREGKLIVMDHFPLRTWASMGHRSWHTYCHSHGDLESIPGVLSVDVSVDSIAKYLGGKQEDYRPIEFEELSEIISKISKDGFVMNRGSGSDPLTHQCFSCNNSVNNWIPICDNCIPKKFPNAIRIDRL